MPIASARSCSTAPPSDARNADPQQVGPALRQPPEPWQPRRYPTVHERGGKGSLLDFPPFEDLAENLRKHLARAGVNRPELCERTASSTWITFHDLRATGISWMAMRPDVSPYDVRDYAGHSELSTTDLYIRRGRKARGGWRTVPRIARVTARRGREFRSRNRSHGRGETAK